MSVREAWASMRLSVSPTARLFGRPVSESVAARSSAIARLRRFARTGAACPTDVADPLLLDAGEVRVDG